MAQTVNQTSPADFDLQHYRGIIRRRHLQFLILMFLGWAAVWGSSWILPASYKSTALILVEQPTMPKDYVKPNVNQDLEARLQSITQQVLSRTRLLHIIDELNLYARDRRRLGLDEVVARMGKDINIEFVNDAQKQVVAFKINYSANSPAIAQQVTSKLTNLFINENLEVRQQQSEGTTKFLEDQLETARQNLSEQEEKIRAFKGQHLGELPTQLGSNLQILSGLQSQLETEERALNTSKQQQVYSESLLREYEALQGLPKTSDGTAMSSTAIDQELDKLNARLAEVSSRYKEQMPEVRKLKQQIATMEKMRDQLAADPKTADPRTKGSGTQPDVNVAASTKNAVDPKNQPQIFNLQSQLRANQLEIKNHEQMISALKSKINDYQARLNQEPVREQQLADLTRGYDQSKAAYDELLKKKNESAMATSMELLQQGEHFRIVDPPSLPAKPSFPDRLKFCLAGLAVGLGLGVGVTGVSERMDDRVYSEKELKRLLPVSVVSEIPLITNPAKEKAEQKRAWLGWVTTAFVFVTILVGFATSYFMG